jgi:hypothetical protein
MIKEDSKRYLTYRGLRTTEGKKVARFVAELTNGKVSLDDRVHLDPDIRPELRDKKHCSLPLTFGQSGIAQRELEKKGVKQGDLFLFFGWFRKADERSPGSFRFTREASDIHAIWGWLQIGQVLDLNDSLQRREARRIAPKHPHVVRPNTGKADCLYVAKNTLAFLPSRRGAGAFREFHEAIRLSNGQRDLSEKLLRSRWKLPAFFKDVKMTHLPGDPRWELIGESVLFDCAKGRGQEFIFETKGHEKAVARWLEGIFNRKRRQSA